MDIGIGLPTTLAGIDGSTVLAWAQGAEQAGFDSLAVTDRLVYRTHDPLVTLGAAAAVTSRVRLLSAVLLPVLRSNAVGFAKQAATVDQLSNGRLAIGIGVGTREDEFAVAGVDYHRRGALLDELVDIARSVWRGELGVGPMPVTPGGPPLLVGGHSPAALRRMARVAEGWIGGSGGAAGFAQGAAAASEAWSVAGRDGAPRFLATAVFALEPGAHATCEAYLSDYYAFDPARVPILVESAYTDADDVKQAVADYAAAGCGELIFLPCDADPRQLELLAAAIGR